VVKQIPPIATFSEQSDQNKLRELLETLYSTVRYNITGNGRCECLKSTEVRQSASKRRIGEGSEAIPKGSRGNTRSAKPQQWVKIWSKVK